MSFFGEFLFRILKVKKSLGKLRCDQGKLVLQFRNKIQKLDPTESNSENWKKFVQMRDKESKKIFGVGFEQLGHDCIKYDSDDEDSVSDDKDSDDKDSVSDDKDSDDKETDSNDDDEFFKKLFGKHQQKRRFEKKVFLLFCIIFFSYFFHIFQDTNNQNSNPYFFHIFFILYFSSGQKITQRITSKSGKTCKQVSKQNSKT